MKERIERKLDGYITAILEKETLTASMALCCCDIFGGKKDGLQ